MGRLLDRAYLVPLAVIGLHAAVAPLRVNHDCAQFLLAGRTFADGGRPYLDALDTNPPLVMYLSTVPALLERLFPLHITAIFALLVIAAAAASAAALRRLLAHDALGLAREEAAVIALLWATATLEVDATLELGQRDHLFMLAFYPYAVARWIRVEGGRVPAATAIALGVATGLTASFRPSLVLLVLALEAGLAAARRSARGLVAPETVALAATGAAYGLHFLLLPADVRHEIFERWGPLIALGYSAFDSPLSTMVAAKPLAFTLAAAAIPWVLSAAAPPEPPPFWRLARALAPLTALAATLYVLERKDWSYRLHPTFGGAVLLVGLGLVLVLRRLAPATRDGAPPGAVPAASAPEGPVRRIRAGAVLAACLVLLSVWRPDGLVGVTAIDRRCVEVAVALERYSSPGDPVLFLATGVTPAHPAVLQTDRRVASRFLTLFPIALLRRRPDPEEERRFVDDLRRDVARSDPDLVFVQREGDPAMPRGTTCAGWLDERGALAPLLAGRRLAGRFGGMDLYVRAPRASPPRGGGAR